MPEANEMLATFSIPKLNNLYTLIGAHAYQKRLKNHPPLSLTPMRFQKLAQEEIKEYSDFR